MSQTASRKGNGDSLTMCRALITQSQGSIEPIETSALGVQPPLGGHSLNMTACDRIQAIAAISIPAYSQRKRDVAALPADSTIFGLYLCPISFVPNASFILRFSIRLMKRAWMAGKSAEVGIRG